MRITLVAQISDLIIRHGKSACFDSKSGPMRMLPDKFLAAMIGVLPLPGAPRYAGSSKAVISRALRDLEHYLKAGIDVIVLENSHDIPYIKPPLDPRGIALKQRLAKEVRRRFAGPVGIQLLEAANESALEVACEADLDFVRVEGSRVAQRKQIMCSPGDYRARFCTTPSL